MGQLLRYNTLMSDPRMHREAPYLPEGFCDLVRQQMEKTGLSLRAVAGEVGISPAYLSRLLSRERGLPPDDDMILKLATVLQIDPPELLLVEAKRVPEALLPALLSAHHATSKAEIEQAMKRLQAVIIAQRRKKGRKQ